MKDTSAPKGKRGVEKEPPPKPSVNSFSTEAASTVKSVKIYTETLEKGNQATKEKGKGKGTKGSKDSSAPAVEPAVAAISTGEGLGDRSEVALAASRQTDDFPRNNIRSWLMDTGCKHDLTTRDAIPYCQLGVITKSLNPVLLGTASDIV